MLDQSFESCVRLKLKFLDCSFRYFEKNLGHTNRLTLICSILKQCLLLGKHLSFVFEGASSHYLREFPSSSTKYVLVSEGWLP